VVLVDDAAENVSPTGVADGRLRRDLPMGGGEARLRKPDRARDGEDEVADAYSRELVSADPPLTTPLAGKDLEKGRVYAQRHGRKG
jgi:hypothetical protein